MKIQTTILTLALLLTACPLPFEPPMDDEAGEAGEEADTTDDIDTMNDADATEDTTEETEPSDSGTIDPSDSTGDSSDSDESNDESTDESADESDESSEGPLDMPMEDLGCCVCLTFNNQPSCIFPAVADECESLGLFVGQTPVWVPCFVDESGGLVCEVECPL